jgi:hypothetical protein
MKAIKELAPKPSDALQAMVDGLRTQSKRSDFKLMMSTYGSFDEKTGICYGCAATCTIQELAHQNLTIANIKRSEKRANALSFYPLQLMYFESAIDSVRTGTFDELEDYYELKRGTLQGLHDDNDFYWYLSDINWEEYVPAIERFIKLLQENNL